jgi:formylmethanofuran dehydrogenase subunit E
MTDEAYGRVVADRDRWREAATAFELAMLTLMRRLPRDHPDRIKAGEIYARYDPNGCLRGGDDMSWDEPTREQMDDATIEDTVHCARCGASYVLPEGYIFGDRSVCVECTQDEIDELMARLDDDD